MLVQPGSIVDPFFNSQLVSSTSQIPTYLYIPLEAQIHVIQPLQVVTLTQSILSLSGTP